MEDRKIADIKFKTVGCVSSIASASAITELVKGRKIEEAYSITPEHLLKELKRLISKKR